MLKLASFRQFVKGQVPDGTRKGLMQQAQRFTEPTFHLMSMLEGLKAGLYAGKSGRDEFFFEIDNHARKFAWFWSLEEDNLEPLLEDYLPKDGCKFLLDFASASLGLLHSYF